MAWSIAEVARMSRTTSRTLRHYDEIGLLMPAFVGTNGYRYYEQDQLLRLQQILLLRELDLGLPVIARILSGQQDATAALHAHIRRLRKEQVRLQHLQRTVERTLAQLQGGTTMPVEEYFDGFGQKQVEYERELIDLYGEDTREHIEESHRKTADWSKQDFATAMSGFQEHLGQLAALMRDGKAADSQEVQEHIAGHHGWLAQFWTPDRESYAGLGELYASDPRFRKQFDAIAPNLADFMRDAMSVYAETNLS